MTKESPNSKLEDFRYDAKLFKQAYKAGLKLKEFEAQQKRRRLFSILGAITLTIVVGFLALFLYRSPLFKPVTYISARYTPESFEEFKPEYETSPISATKQFDYDFLEANNALYADLNTGEILYGKNADEQEYIASITKLMTALVALKEYELSEVVEVKKDWFAEDGMSWTLGLDKGDSITVESLLNAILISSYNDAAFALADHMEGGWEVFVEEMNSYAELLGMDDTKFYNPSGLDDYGGNLSTAKDLYRLSSVVYRSEVIMELLTKGYLNLEWDIGSEEIYTTNAIIGQYGNIAGKTGQTELAGGCFLGITEDGRMTVVLGAENRFDESIKLLTEL